jgi:ribosomal protein L40E
MKEKLPCLVCNQSEFCKSIGHCHDAILRADWEEHRRYLAAGVCSKCGATSAEEAEKLCRPEWGITDEYECPGENLWQQPEKGT